MECTQCKKSARSPYRFLGDGRMLCTTCRGKNLEQSLIAQGYTDIPNKYITLAVLGEYDFIDKKWTEILLDNKDKQNDAQNTL